MNPPRSSSRRKWVMRAAKLVIVALVLWFVHRTLRDGIEQLREYRLTVRAGWLAVAGAIYLLGLLPAGLFWYRVLVVLGQEPRWFETLRAYYIGHLGKYVPGKAMVVVLRAGLIRSQRVETGIAAASVFVETLTMMAVGAFLAAAHLALRAGPGQVALLAAAVGLMVVAGLPTLPPVFRRLARLAGVGRSHPETGEKLARLGFGTLALGWLMMVVCWVLLGASFWAVLRAMGVETARPLIELPLYTAAVALAMVAGFLSLIPGGVVVRDVILAEFMAEHFAAVSPQFGGAIAVVSAVLLRVVWLVAELVISGILYLCGARRPQVD